jgi:uncharacterized repeat protein (TIGR01451 family)
MSSRPTRRPNPVPGAILSALIGCGALLGAGSPLLAQVSLTTLGVPHTQNFDTLPASGSATWANNSTIPGWFHARTGNGTTVVANDGSSNAGNLYSYGTGTATDRSLGSVGSGNAAIGNLFWGVRLQNNTGATIASLDVSYTGEQWRNSAAAAQTISFSYLVGSPTVTGSLAEFQSTGVPVAALNFTSPITGGTAGALNGNLAANRTSITFSITGLSIPNGSEVMLRWSDPDHTGADHGLSIDDFSVTPQGAGPVTPALNISDVTLAEGDPPGTTTFTFAVTLTAPAGAGGVTFDIATADGTAQDGDQVGEDTDYVAQTQTGQTIPMGSTGPYNFSVTVNRDTDIEPNQTFFVNVTNITGANAGDTQGQGTITNDDVALTPIHDIQGPGGSSPIVGASVTTRGIVTGLRTNGFFIQEPDASVDADPATSEGILVFTGGAPPAAAVVGALVQVTGTVTEFVPSADALQPPLTEITGPTVVQLSTGNPLPAPIPLNATFPDPAGPHDQLERLEGMRVSVASLTVVGPTLGFISEANATATSSGVFYGVVTGVARPFREAGIPAPDPAPSGGGTIPPIPRFDSNPERIRVDSDGQVGGPLLDVSTGAVVTGLVGPLDYTFRTYTILPDPGATIGVTGGATPTSITAAIGREFTVASYNVQRFYDNVDDPGGDVALTTVALERRLDKASLAIRNHLLMPDIIGLAEVEKLSVLQTLAAQISADAIADSQPDPEYVAYLVEGNDVGGIDVAFLVKTASVDGGTTPRVEVVSVTQEGAGSLFVNPDTSTELLNDRPPLVLEAIVHHPNGASFPVTVIANHLRSLGSVNSEAAGSNGWPTSGARVRAKRQAQAEELANLVQARQIADPTENIIVLGDFNAFEVNDGLGDSMGVIDGTPAPDNETAVPGDGVDLVNPDLDNLFDSPPPAERYSYVFDGNAQNLDHILINAPLDTATVAHRAEHARINADFPETARNDGTTGVRLSDHDPMVAFFAVPAFSTADLSLTKTDSPDPVAAGTNLTYTITVTNSGPDVAENVSWSDTLPAGTTFTSLSAPGGWSCTTPAVGAGGTVTCSIASLPVASPVFTLTVGVAPAVSSGTVLSNTATVSSTTAEGNPGNESGNATTTVSAVTGLGIAKTDNGNDPVVAGTNLTYTITVSNSGPSNAANVGFSDPLPADTTFVSLASPGGWSCTTPAVGANGTVSCSIASLPVTAGVDFTLVVAVGASVPANTVLSNTASIDITTLAAGPIASATETTTVIAPTLVSATKSVTGSFQAGGTVFYNIVLSNASTADQADLAGDEFTDVLPASMGLVAASASAGTATANLGTNTVTWNGVIPGGGSVTITIEAVLAAGLALGTEIENQGTTSSDADGNGTNEAAGVTDDPTTGDTSDATALVVGGLPAEIPTVGEWGLIGLGALLAGCGAARLRRRRPALRSAG